MKRPILGLLAAATLMFGVAGIAPAGAAVTERPAAAAATPAHDADGEGRHKHSHRDGGGHPTRSHDRHFHGGDEHDDGHDDHDGGHDRGRRRRCEGLIVICLV